MIFILFFFFFKQKTAYEFRISDLSSDVCSSDLVVWGPDLEADLAALNAHFAALPDEEKAKVLFTLASKPPADHNGLVADLWDARMPGWRTPKPPAPKMAPKAEAEIIARSRGLVDAARRSRPSFLDSGEDVEHLVIERHLPKKRGNWRMFSAAVAASSDADGGDGKGVMGGK